MHFDSMEILAAGIWKKNISKVSDGKSSAYFCWLMLSINLMYSCICLVLISIKVNVSIYLQTDYWHSTLVSPPLHQTFTQNIVDRAARAGCLMTQSHTLLSYNTFTVSPCCPMILRLCHAPGWPARWVDWQGSQEEHHYQVGVPSI